MPPKSLLILIEGKGDKPFFDEVIKPLLERKYHQVYIKRYRELGKTGINTVINESKKKGNDYIFITDMDKIQCISGKKQDIMTDFNSINDKSRIMIVIRKIECWYIAGLSDEKYKEFGDIPPKDTNKLGKRFFGGLMKKGNFKSDIDFMQEILKDFDIETAKQRNISFKYFVDKYCLQ